MTDPTPTSRPAETLARLTAPERRRLTCGAALSALASLLWLPQAALLAVALGRALDGGFDVPWLWSGGFLVLGLVRALLSSRAEAILFAAAEAVVADARAALLTAEAHRAGAGPQGPGALAALATEKLDLLQPYLTRFAPARARVMLLPPLILIASATLSWAVALVLLVSGPLIPVFQALVGMAAREASQRQMREIGSLNDLLVDRLSALADLRLLDAGTRVAAGFRAASERLRAETMAVLRIAFLSSAVLELFAAIGVAMVAVWCGFAVLDSIRWGSWGVPLGPAAALWLLLLAPEFFQPLRDLSAAWHDHAAAEAVAEELAALDAAARREMPGPGGRAIPLPGAATIRLAGVAVQRGTRRLAYPDLQIMPGETLALTGPSGAGKTTLLRLLAGLEAPDAGQIEVAGRPLDAEHADAWRARLGWMPQGPWFLGESLRSNLTLGRGGDLAGAIAAAAAGPVVAALPRGLTTRLGERGAGLSGGEARRMALARALFARPDVILADEPTADLDAETAQAVTAGLLAEAGRGATLIVATHDARLAAALGRRVEIGEA